MSTDRIVHIVGGVAVIPDDGHAYKLAITCERCGKDITHPITMRAGAFTDSEGGTWGCRACGKANAAPSFIAGSQADIDAHLGGEAT